MKKQNVILDNNKILLRLSSYKSIYDALEELQSTTTLDMFLLRNCIISYYIDLERSKNFHGIEYSDDHKRAAYAMKWITKIRPIQILPGIKPTKYSILANEIFALYAGLGCIQGLTIADLSTTYCRNLMYSLRYRDIEPCLLSCHMYVLDKAIKKKLPNCQ